MKVLVASVLVGHREDNKGGDNKSFVALINRSTEDLNAYGLTNGTIEEVITAYLDMEKQGQLDISAVADMLEPMKLQEHIQWKRIAHPAILAYCIHMASYSYWVTNEMLKAITIDAPKETYRLDDGKPVLVSEMAESSLKSTLNWALEQGRK